MADEHLRHLDDHSRRLGFHDSFIAELGKTREVTLEQQTIGSSLAKLAGLQAMTRRHHRKAAKG